MRAIPPDCPRLPVLRPHVDGLCDWDGKPLPKGRKRWCSDRCAGALWNATYREHDWNAARATALKRDRYRCVRCGSDGKPPAGEAAARYQLEVNHIVPRVGSGYGMGCHNHLDNLETLCHPCHVKVTNGQRVARGRGQSQMALGAVSA